ncbi:MAG: MBL fold metallo-hydrolase [Alphaproteobacteria bacterium]|nr:MBL fold metallo-hydrolase [Alphaproteobacteria bacterium]
MQPTRLGEFEISRIADFAGPSFDPGEFFPDFDPEVVRANADLLGPSLIDPASGKLVFSFHSFVVKTPRHTILIDACIGNDKERPARPQWHHLRSPYLADLAAAGVTPEQVDYVLCTHLHWDHVGWNTRLADGPDGRQNWVPTFPNARYVMARREFGHWQQVHDRGDDTPHATAFADSVLPVVATGQAELVGDDYALEDGLWFEGAPGHTPGNIVIHARSGEARGLFVGDVLHHPLQLLKPEWSTRACSDMELSRKTRTRLIEQHADSDTLVLPAHFPPPTAGHIRRRGAAYHFVFQE